MRIQNVKINAEANDRYPIIKFNVDATSLDERGVTETSTEQNQDNACNSKTLVKGSEFLKDETGKYIALEGPRHQASEN